MHIIHSNIKTVQDKIQCALHKAGRQPDDAKLLAVTKTFDAQTISHAYDAGLRMFGENKVQELLTKVPILPQDVQWHVIGHLQQNKVRNAVVNAACIHSVDSPQLLERIQRIAAEENKSPDLLVEVNVSAEESKYGAKPDDVEDLLANQPKGPAQIRGLMTVAPADATELELHHIFAKLRILRDKLQTKLNIQLPELSMGMSHDFEIAIEEGATIVRVGSAIFGHRDYSITH